MKKNTELNKSMEIKDSDLSELGAVIADLAWVIDYPPNKVGAFRKMPVDKDLVKLLKGKHFTQPRKK